MNIWLVSLKPRTTSDLKPQNAAFLKAWNAVFPILIYYTVDVVAIRIGAILINIIATVNPDAAVSIGDSSSLATAIIKMTAVILAACAVMPYFKKEKPIIVHNDAPVSWYIISAFTGACSALFFNTLFTVTGFTGNNSSYAEVADRQLAFSLPVGILVYGLVAPLTEEIVFRGIVYNRMRRDYGLIMSLIMSPLIFGLYHGNYVQAVYGFILGLLITWYYERYGAFIFPFIIHASANIIVYIYSSVNLINSNKILPICIITGVIMTVLLFLSVNVLDRNGTK